MNSFLSSNGSARTWLEVLFFIFLIFLCFSLPAMSIPSRPLETAFNRQNPLPEKFFLNVDNELVTLIVRNNPLGPILEEIGRRAGVKIKVNSAIRSKKITVSWRDVPFEECLKKIAEISDLLFEKEEGGFYLLTHHDVPETGEQFTKIQKDENPPASSNDATQEKQVRISQVDSDASETGFSQNKDLENNIVLNEMVIRFKQDISEQDINQLLSDSNIKVKKYIAALKFHILSLPVDMTQYDAMLLFKTKKMLFQAEPDYLVPVR